MHCHRMLILIATVAHTSVQLFAADPAKLTFVSPKPYQVIQREGFEPNRSSVNEPEGPELGYTDVVVRAPRPDGLGTDWQCRLEVLENGFGRSTTGFQWKRAGQKMN